MFAVESIVRTFRQDVAATALLRRMADNAAFTSKDCSAYAVMCEGLRCITYAHKNASEKLDITLDRITLDRAGYAAGGRYYGTGLQVFRVWVDGDPFLLRAASRKELRAALKRLYPLATIGR